MNDKRQIYLENGALFKGLCEADERTLTFDRIWEKYGKDMRMEVGSAVLRMPSVQGESLACTIWIGVNSVRMMLNKEEISSFLFLLS
jgi:hypothetical protein